MANRRLAGFTIVALIFIQLGTVASHWGEVKGRRPDFAALYSSARLLRHAPPEFTAESPAPAASTETAGMRPDTLHPPLETALFIPLSFLPYTFAYLVWLILNLAMFWSVPFLLWEELGELQVEFHYLAIIYGSMYPVLVCLVQGQDAILLLLLLTIAYRFLKANAQVAAGLLLAAGLFKFQIILPMVLLIAAARRWKVVATFLAVSAGLALLTVGIIGLHGISNYISVVISIGREVSGKGVDDPALMPNLRGLVVSCLAHVASTQTVALVVLLGSLAVLAVAFSWTARNRSLPIRQLFSAVITVSCVVSYHFFAHNAVVLLLPILLVANELILRSTSSVRRTFLATAILAFYLAPSLIPLKIAMPLLGASTLLLSVLLLKRPRVECLVSHATES